MTHIIKRAAVGILTAAILCAPVAAATQQGIDISHYDGAVDYSALRTSGHGQFVYIKALDGEHTVDSYFTRNRQGAGAASVPWGPYQFFRPYSVSSAQTQATNFWNLIKGTGYSLTPVVDAEVYENAYTSAELRADLQAFCDTFQVLSGEKPVIYTYTSFIRENNLAAHFSGYKLWQAQYSSNRTDTGWDAQVWQYSDKGSVPGVTAPSVDLNALYDTSVYENGSAVSQASSSTSQSMPQVSSDYYVVSSLPQAANSRAGTDFYIRDRYGNRIGNHQVDAGDPIIILSVDYSTQLVEILYPNYAAGGWYHGYITNAEAYLHNTGYNAWRNGSTDEPVYDKAGSRIGTIYPREQATVLDRSGSMTKVLYGTSKGAETKSGFVKYQGK